MSMTVNLHIRTTVALECKLIPNFSQGLLPEIIHSASKRSAGIVYGPYGKPDPRDDGCVADVHGRLRPHQRLTRPFVGSPAATAPPGFQVLGAGIVPASAGGGRVQTIAELNQSHPATARRGLEPRKPGWSAPNSPALALYPRMPPAPHT